MTTLEFERQSLLAPAPGDDACGPWLRRAGTYREVQEAQRAEPGDPAYGIPEKVPDWEAVERICADALKRSKDLYLAVCLLEAWTRQRGAEGLRDGLWLLSGLHREYWGGFHPRPRDDDVEGRLNLLEGFRARFAQTLLELPLSAPDEGLTYGAWSQAGKKLPSGEPSAWTVERRDAAVRSTDREFYERSLAALREARAEVDELSRSIRERYGDQAMSLAEVGDACDEAIGAFERALTLKGPSPRRERDETSARTAPPEPVAPTGDSTAADRPPVVVPRAVEGVPGDKTGVLAACRALRASEPDDSAAYLCTRWLRWSELLAWPGEIPPADLPAPPQSLRDELERSFATESQWAELLERCEATIATEPEGACWLDLQRYSFAALRSVAPRARSALLKGFAAFLEQCRWLVESELSDGTAAADPITRDWIAKEVLARSGSGSAPPEAASDAPGHGPLVEQARAALAEGGLDRAVALFHEREREAGSERERFELRLALVDLCFEGSADDMARAVLEGLVSIVEERGLETWESREFVAKPLDALLRHYVERQSSGRASERIAGRIDDLSRQLARIEPARLLKPGPGSKDTTTSQP